jgi:hypothetical protein
MNLILRRREEFLWFPARPPLPGLPEFDSLADRCLARTVFDETAFGVARGLGISAVLELRKHRRRLRS